MGEADVYVAGAGMWLPKTVTLEQAVADGRCELSAMQRTRFRQVAIAGDEDTQPDMAVRAGRQALSRSGHAPGDVGLLLHAVANYNGLDGWNTASYLQHHIIEGSGIAYEIRQLSNGGVASIQLAAAYLRANPSSPAAMITASDKFGEPAYNRWRTSAGTIFADGASALVLSRDRGFAKIRSAVTACDPGLEGMYRGAQRFWNYPHPGQYPIDLEARALEFSDVIPLEQSRPRLVAGMRNAAAAALAEAGVDMDDVDRFITPHFGYELMQRSCLLPLGGLDIERTTWDWATQVGHIGAADHFAALCHLVETDQLARGDLVMLACAGGGFNWTCSVLEIVDKPDWSAGY